LQLPQREEEIKKLQQVRQTFLSLTCETIKRMYILSNLPIKDKARRRAGESPVSTNYVCRFAAPPSPFLKQKNMRNDKQKTIRRPDVRSLKIQPKTRFNKHSQKDVPEIKLCGDWLQNIGFQLGERVTVTSMPNLLIIRTAE
jgi:hypothetical protein